MASLVAPAGVRVAVQVTPSSLLASPDRLPLGTVTSPTVKPVTASLNVKVTVAVSPIFKAVSEMAIAWAREGRSVSNVRAGEFPPAPLLPARSV